MAWKANGCSLKLHMVTVLNVFFIYVTTKWSYCAVVCDIVLSALLELHKTWPV